MSLSKLNFSFQINCNDIDEFVEHWSKQYYYKWEHLYTVNIGKPLTETSLIELYLWKNGTKLSQDKLQSVLDNYPLTFDGCLEDRYLNPNQPGGAIWNIFYMHCLDQRWPIFDQHAFRAMKYIKYGRIIELQPDNQSKYASYIDEYIPFLTFLKQEDYRKLDKALFCFGKFLKTAANYLK